MLRGVAARVDFFLIALDSDPRALAPLSAARPIFGAPVALLGAAQSFRQRGGLRRRPCSRSRASARVRSDKSAGVDCVDGSEHLYPRCLVVHLPPDVG